MKKPEATLRKQRQRLEEPTAETDGKTPSRFCSDEQNPLAQGMLKKLNAFKWNKWDKVSEN